MTAATKARTAPLTTPEAADYIGVKKHTLECWRSRQDKYGPPYIRVGRSIRYRIADLDAYLKANTVKP